MAGGLGLHGKGWGAFTVGIWGGNTVGAHQAKKQAAEGSAACLAVGGQLARSY